MAATNHSVGIAHVTVIPTNAAAVDAECDDATDSTAETGNDAAEECA